MLQLLIGTNWKANRDAILQKIAQDVKAQEGNRVLLVPELISHDMERRLCEVCGDTASRFAEVLSFTRLVSRVSDSIGRRVGACMDDGGRVVAFWRLYVPLHTDGPQFLARVQRERIDNLCRVAPRCVARGEQPFGCCD